MPRISELDVASSGPLNGDELTVVVQGGATVQTTVQEIANLAPGSGNVDSVNGQTGIVVLDAADVGATVDPSLLAGVSNLSGAELLTVEQSGVPVQVTTQQIAGLASGGSGTPAGADKQIQYNNGGAFGAETGFEYDPATNTLTVKHQVGGYGTVDRRPAGDDEHMIVRINDPAVNAGSSGFGFQFENWVAYGTTGYGNNKHFTRADGSEASPANVKSGMFIMSYGFRGFDGTAWSQSAGAFQAIATENWTGSAHGIKFRWETTPNGSTTRALAMELDGNGKLTPNALANKFTALTDGANISVNGGVGNNFRVTLGGNRTLDNPSNMSDGQVFNFRIAQDATGSRTLAYGSKYKWPGGSAPTLTTTANAIDVISCIYDSTSDTLMCAIQKAFG